jgi:hypothetical protein
MKPKIPSIHMYVRLALAGLAVLVAELIFPATTSAHVKWFASYDVTEPPLPFAEVATPVLFAVFAGFAGLLFLAFLADGWAARRLPRLKSSELTFNTFQEKWVRLGTGAFLLCLWAIGLNILTPELHTRMAWVFDVQFISAFCIAWRRTCVISALGFCVLYVYGVSQYGLFHMLDYVYFIGIAVFLAGISLPRLARIRVAVMTGCLAFSIMWTAIEKLVYPHWTQEVLSMHSRITMGINPETFIVLAGFVEFTLAFYLATGRGMLRMGALVLLTVFIMAMPAFGRRDVVGHLPLIAMLIVPLMGGDSALQRFWRLPGRGVLLNASVACLLYAIALSLFFQAYYGVQWLEYSRNFL